MLEVLIGMFAPLVVFGAFALLAVWLGADSRPWFDERLIVREERPNWGPIARRLPSDDEDEADVAGPPDAEPVPEPVVTARLQRPAAATIAATSPAGV
jgi:hypothetical protein